MIVFEHLDKMELDNLQIRENGNLCFGTGGAWNTKTNEFDDYTLLPAFERNETCSYDEMEKRITRLISEILQ